MINLEKIRARYRYSTILLREFVITDFKIRYQNSVLGYLWAVLRPLFMFAVLYVVFVYFLRIGDRIPDWPVALLLGIVMWNFFAEVTNQGLKAVVSNGGLMRKINFPKYIVILSASFSALINMFINLFVIGLFMWVSDVDLHLSALTTPIYFVELYILALGVAFILGSLYVKYRDISYVWEVIMQALFYLSAIIYPVSLILEANESIGRLLLLNPITHAIQGARHSLVAPENVTTSEIFADQIWVIFPVAIVLISVILGGWFFKKNSPKFAEEA